MKKIFGFLFTAIILFMIFLILRNINFFEVYSLLRKINLIYFFLAILFYLIGFLLWNFRFMYTIKKLVSGDFYFFLNVLFAGSFFNTITPGANVGGEPFRAYLLSKKYKKSKSKILGAIFADKSFNLLAFSGFLVFSVLFVLFFIQMPLWTKISLEIFLLCIFSIFILFFLFVFCDKKLKLNNFMRLLYWFKPIHRKFST